MPGPIAAMESQQNGLAVATTASYLPISHESHKHTWGSKHLATNLMICCSIIPFISRFYSVRLSVNGTLLDPYGEVLASEFLPMAAFNNLMTSQKTQQWSQPRASTQVGQSQNILHIYTRSKYNTRYRRIIYFPWIAGPPIAICNMYLQVYILYV